MALRIDSLLYLLPCRKDSSHFSSSRLQSIMIRAVRASIRPTHSSSRSTRGYHSDSYNPSVNRLSASFSPGLAALIRLDRQNTPKGDVGALDFDPVCDCQDPDGLKLTDLGVTQTTPQKATAFVTLRYGSNPEQKHLQLKLLWTPAGWRIDDIASPEMASLRSLLAHDGSTKHG